MGTAVLVRTNSGHWELRIPRRDELSRALLQADERGTIGCAPTKPAYCCNERQPLGELRDPSGGRRQHALRSGGHALTIVMFLPIRKRGLK